MADIDPKFDIISDYAEFLRYSIVHEIGYAQDEVDKLTSDECVILAYFRIQRRLVADIPRVIHKARDFSCPGQYVNALQEIERRIKAGENINPYLSRRLIDVEFNDLLLNDWGIQHLHLGASVILEGKNKGFIKGTKALLYVCFDDKCAYFVRILERHDFTAQTLLQTMHDNWPKILSKYHNKHITGDRITDKEIKELRRKNLNFCIALADGTSYVAIGGGITMSGDNATDVMRLNYLHHWADHESKKVKAHFPGMIERMENQGRKVKYPITLRLKILDLEQRVWVLDDDYNKIRVPLHAPWR